MATPGLHEPDKDSYEASHHVTPPNHNKIEHGLDIVENLPQIDDYPHGTRLIIIILSLMLSTFIVALDNVRISPCLHGSSPHASPSCQPLF